MGDPFDIFNEDLEEEKVEYKPLKRKFKCVDDNSNSEKDNSCLTNCPDLNKDHKVSASDGTKEDGEAEVGLDIGADVKKGKTQNRQVAYVYSDELKDKTNNLIRIQNRAELVHSLVRTYGLLKYVRVLEPRSASEAEILGFHSREYIDCLRGVGSFTDSEDIPEALSCDADEYGLSYDCPQQTGIFDTASLIGGATITAAEALLDGSAHVAINWYGGWHHAKRDSASGFCYINDIVLGILKLREKYDHVLYVDLDLHHGDGVEEAFSMTSKVMTVSFHKMATGFFPGTGSVEDVGVGKGKFYSVNVPLKDGIRDQEFVAVFCRVMKMVKEKFGSQALVVQCGADGLSEDPMVSFNLTHIGLAKCVYFLLSWELPTLLLGGGGYNLPNTAKCWTYLTSLAVGKKLPLDIPEHEHLLEYGPSYELTTSVGNRKDCNTREDLMQVITAVARNLRHIT